MMCWYKDTVFRFSILGNRYVNPCLNGPSADSLSKLQRYPVNSDSNDSIPVPGARRLPLLVVLRLAMKRLW